MDRWTALLSILFVLSLIAEKITTTIKLNIPFLRDRSQTSVGEKSRELAITWVSLSISFLVAIVMHADGYALLTNEDPSSTLKWIFASDSRSQDISFVKDLLMLLPGALILTPALAVGSKFWQDLLDLTLQTRRLKESLRQLNDSEYMVNIQTATDLLTSPYSNSYRAVKQHKPSLMENEGVVAIAAGSMSDNAAIADIVTIGIDTQVVEQTGLSIKLPKSLIVHRSEGPDVLVPVELKSLGRAEICNPKISDRVANKSTVKRFGTLGFFAIDRDTNEKVFVTCWHVVKHSSHLWNRFRPEGYESVVLSPSGDKVGSIVDSVRNHYLDVATVLLEEGYLPQTEVPGVGHIRGYRTADWSDVAVKSSVFMRGASSNIQSGIIAHPSIEERKIWYSTSEEWTLKNLIAVVSSKGGALGKKGDSGAIVMDANGIAIGMLIASDDSFSYLMPIQSIVDEFHLTMVTKS